MSLKLFCRILLAPIVWPLAVLMNGFLFFAEYLFDASNALYSKRKP